MTDIRSCWYEETLLLIICTEIQIISGISVINKFLRSSHFLPPVERRSDDGKTSSEPQKKTSGISKKFNNFRQFFNKLISCRFYKAGISLLSCFNLGCHSFQHWTITCPPPVTGWVVHEFLRKKTRTWRITLKDQSQATLGKITHFSLLHLERHAR